jgi:hypothetical protein
LYIAKLRCSSALCRFLQQSRPGLKTWFPQHAA